MEDIKTETSRNIKEQNGKIAKVMGHGQNLAHLLNQSMAVVKELKTQNKEQSKRIDQLEQKLATMTRDIIKEKVENGSSNNNGQVSKKSTPPSSCKELAMLDHYLDGLYLVKNKKTKKIQTVFCKFSGDNQGRMN